MRSRRRLQVVPFGVLVLPAATQGGELCLVSGSSRPRRRSVSEASNNPRTTTERDQCGQTSATTTSPVSIVWLPARSVAPYGHLT
ncbi:hypothetical protein ACFPM0_20190 [Pseudonocardia sulfidoxydans]|uniref:hypothetical protein n=1 Tax=Pseudonocardia sulfidoxydans TaxID=54011 RepID=UPI00361F6215